MVERFDSNTKANWLQTGELPLQRNETTVERNTKVATWVKKRIFYNDSSKQETYLLTYRFRHSVDILAIIGQSVQGPDYRIQPFGHVQRNGYDVASVLSCRNPPESSASFHGDYTVEELLPCCVFVR